MYVYQYIAYVYEKKLCSYKLCPHSLGYFDGIYRCLVSSFWEILRLYARTFGRRECLLWRHVFAYVCILMVLYLTTPSYNFNIHPYHSV